MKTTLRLPRTNKLNRKNRATGIRRGILATSIAAAVGLLTADSAKAASGAWTGTTNAVWATATNWNPNTTPGTGDTATFNGAGNGNVIINLGGGVTINTVAFDLAAAAAYTIGSGAVNSQTLTLDPSGAVTMSAAVVNNQLFNSKVVLGNGAAQTFTFTNNSANTLTFAGTVDSTTAGLKTLTVNGSGATAISGAVTNTVGSTALVMGGTGTLTLSGANTYSGTTTVNLGGTVAAGAANTFSAVSAHTVNGTMDLMGHNNKIGSLAGAGVVQSTGGAAVLTANQVVAGVGVNTTFSGQLTDGTGQLGLTVGNGVTAGSVLNLTGATNNYTGATTVNALATLQGGAVNSFSAVSAHTVNGTMDLMGNNNTIGSLAGAGVVQSTGGAAVLTTNQVVGGAGVTTTFAGQLTNGTGTLGLTVGDGVTAPGGTLKLTGVTNNYSGLTTVNTLATLQGGATNSFSAASQHVVNGTLDLNGFSNTIGSLAGAGTVDNTTGAAVTLTTGGDNSTTAFNGVIKNSGGGFLTLTKTGAGTFTLGGANTYQGATNVTAGILQLNNAGALGNGILNTIGVAVTGGAALDLNGITPLAVVTANLNGQFSGTVGALTNSSGTAATWNGSVNLVSASSIGGAGDITLAGPVGGAFALTKVGADNLFLTNNTNGTTTLAINAGNVQVGVGGTTGALGSGAITVVAATSTLTINRSNAFTIAVGNAISGAGNFTQAGTGTTTVNSANTYTGATAVTAGVLQLNNVGALGNGAGLDTSGVTVSNLAALDLNGISANSNANVNINGTTATAGVGALTNSSATAATWGGLGGAASVTLQSASSIGGNNGNIILNGPLNGAFALTKIGTDTLILANNTNATTSTTINGGVLQIGNAGATGRLGAGTVTIAAAGNLTFNLTGTPPTVGNFITGAGGVTQAGTGTTNLSGANNYTGPTTINAGVLQAGVATVGATGAFGNGSAVTINGGTLDLNTFSNTIGALSGAAGSFIDNTGGTAAVLTTNNSGAATTYSGIIQNTGASTLGLTKAGTATLTLNGVNTYTGPTLVTGGVLQAGAASGGTAFGVNSAVTVSAATVLDLNGTSNTIGSLAGAGTVDNTGAGVQVLTVSGVGGGATNTIFSGVIQNTGAGTLGLTKAAGGATTLTLTGANTYTGATNANGGTLQIGNGVSGSLNALSAVGVGAAGNLGVNLAPGGTFGNAIAITGAGKVTANNGNTQTFSNAITGGVAGSTNFTQTGAGLTILANAGNTYAGLTNVTLGTLQLGSVAPGPVAVGSVGAGAISVNGGGTLSLVNIGAPGALANAISNVVGGAGTVNVNSANVNTLSGALTDAGGATTLALTQSGSGTTILTNAGNTYTGATTVNAGVLQVGVAGGAAGSVGSTATTINVNTGGTLTVANVGGPVAGTLGNAISNTLGGTGTVNVTPAAGATTFLTGIISNGAGTLTLNQIGVATGRTILTNNGNSYTGPTTVTSGILQIGNGVSGAINAASNVTVSPAAFLDLNMPGTVLFANAVTDNGTIRNINAAGTTTNFGPGGIAGVGAFLQNGAGTGILIGANTYTGATTANAGVLQIGNGMTGSISATSLVSTAAGATLATDLVNNGILTNNIANAGTVNAIQTGINTLSGIISGAGNVTQNGTGTTVLSGVNTYTGGTTLNTGILAFGNASAFGKGNLIVNGGTLQNATLGTTNVPLNVNIGNGNFVSNGGIYVAIVGGPDGGTQLHDQITTTGMVTGKNNGQFLTLTQTNGYRLNPGDQVTLVSATGGVAGGTALGTPVAPGAVGGLAAFSNSPLLVPTVNLYQTAIILEAMQGSFAGLNGFALGNGQFLTLTPNQLSAATALDSVAKANNFKTGGPNSTNPAFLALGYIDNASAVSLRSVPGLLDRLTPDELASIFSIGTELSSLQNTNLMRHFDEFRAEGGSAASGLVNNLNSVSVSSSNPDGMEGPRGRGGKEIRAPRQYQGNERWGTFLMGSGNFSRVGSTSNAAGYDFTTGGVTVGIEYKVMENLVVGVDAGYANTSTDLTNGGKVDVNGGQFGLFASYFNSGFYVDAAGHYGVADYRTRRAGLGGLATGSPDGDSWSAFINTGYDFKVGGWTIGPTVNFQYTNTHLDRFTETGSLAPLTVSGHNGESIRTNVGFRAFYDCNVGGIILRPEVRAGWQHEYSSASEVLTSNFATLGGNAFNVNGPVVGRDALLVGTGVTMVWNTLLSTFVAYDGELARTNATSHSVSGGVRIKF